MKKRKLYLVGINDESDNLVEKLDKWMRKNKPECTIVPYPPQIKNVEELIEETSFNFVLDKFADLLNIDLNSNYSLSPLGMRFFQIRLSIDRGELYEIPVSEENKIDEIKNAVLQAFEKWKSVSVIDSADFIKELNFENINFLKYKVKIKKCFLI